MESRSITTLVKEKRQHLEVLAHVGNEIFHPTVETAVDACLEEYAVGWTS